MKTCSKCGIEKELGEFYKDKSKKDGHASRCRECNRAVGASWRKDNQERKRKSDADYYAANKSRVKKRAAKWFKEQPAWKEFARIRLAGIQRRTVNGNNPDWDNPACARYLDRGIELRMTRDEWYSWCESQAETIDQIIADGNTPSIDRIDPAGHYEPGNIQVITFSENVARSNR